MDQQRSKKILKDKTKVIHKIFKTKTLEDEYKYKNYKSLFKKLRRKAKITYFSKLFHKYKTDSKRTWQVMKEIIFSPEKLKSNKTIIQKPQEIAK